MLCSRNVRRRDVGIDLVEDVGERDDVAGALREAGRARPPRSSFTSWPSSTSGSPAGYPSASMPDCIDFTWPWWSAPQMSMRCSQPALELVAVVREVVAEVGGSRRRTSPARGRAGHRSRWCAARWRRRLLEHVRPRLRRSSSTAATVARSRAACAPRTTCRSARRCDRGRRGRPATAAAVSPVARLLRRDGVAQLGPHPIRHLDEVLALVAVLGRLLPAIAREQRRGEGVELGPGVVQVVLAVHLGALGREEVRDRVADRDPTPTAGVDRAGGVRRRRTRG